MSEIVANACDRSDCLCHAGKSLGFSHSNEIMNSRNLLQLDDLIGDFLGDITGGSTPSTPTAPRMYPALHLSLHFQCSI